MKKGLSANSQIYCRFCTVSGLVKDAASLLTKTTSSIMTDSTCSTYKYSL